MSADSVFQRVPPLGFEFELLSISRDEHSAEGFLCDVAYLLDAFHLFDFGMVADRYGEEPHLHCQEAATAGFERLSLVLVVRANIALHIIVVSAVFIFIIALLLHCFLALQ